jgi:hypothetical protein
MSSDTTKIASTGILKNLAIPATDLPLRFIKVCGLQKTAPSQDAMSELHAVSLRHSARPRINPSRTINPTL